MNFEFAQRTENLNVYYINSVVSYSKYIVQDDTKMPYSVYRMLGKTKLQYYNDLSDETENSPQLNIRCFVAPLYKRMYMDAQKAENTIIQLLDTPNLTPCDIKSTSMAPGSSSENPIIFRLFLASSRHYKLFRIDNLNKDSIAEMYQKLPFPQFIWACELYDKKGYENHLAFGEIILDATYSGMNLINSCLLINYPDRFLTCTPYDDNANNSLNLLEWIYYNKNQMNCKYPSYNLNLNNGSSKNEIK